jgi:AcrR family transcriptional regulator
MTVPTPRPRTKLAQERREDLMNAAQRLFLEQGIEPTTIEQITSAADVAKGTFYLHFSSKDDVRAALGERFAHQHLAKIKAAIAQKQRVFLDIRHKIEHFGGGMPNPPGGLEIGHENPSRC